MQTVRVAKGSFIFEQGASALDGMYLILDGNVGLYAEDDPALLNRSAKYVKVSALPTDRHGLVHATTEWPPDLSAPPSPAMSARLFFGKPRTICVPLACFVGPVMGS
jgi:CRP-like cAMP-binding protein